MLDGIQYLLQVHTVHGLPHMLALTRLALDLGSKERNLLQLPLFLLSSGSIVAFPGKEITTMPATVPDVPPSDKCRS